MSFVQQLFATSNVDKLREFAKGRTLRRALTAKDLVAIGLGTISDIFMRACAESRR